MIQPKPELRKTAERPVVALPPDDKLHFTLVNSLGGIVWEADAATFQFTFVSPQAEKILGYPIERWLSDPSFWRDHTHPDDRDWCVEFCVDATANRRDHEFQYRMIAADGRVVWLHDIVSVKVEPDKSVRLRGIMIDITERKQAEALISGQKQVLEMIATGAPLSRTLEALVRLIEAQSVDMIGSILLLDADGVHLRHGAAPNLPDSYNYSIDGVAIGEGVGSCGTAAFRREPVIVEDISTDPLWKDFRDLPLGLGLRACWSTPILDARGGVLGTFALYFRKPGKPLEHHWRLIAVANDTAAIAISRVREEEELRASQERFSRAFDLSPLRMGVLRIRDGVILDLNVRWLREMGFPRDEIIGHSIFQLTRWLGKDQHSLARTLLEGREPFREVEFRMNTASGEQRLVLVSAEVIELGGEQCLLLAANDVTERKRAEEALRRNEELFRAIVEDQTEMIVRWKPDSTRTFVNQAYCRAFGGTPEEFIGKSFFPLIVEEYRESIRQKIRSLTPENPTATESHESVRPGGEVCWQEWTDRGIFDGQGNLVELQSVGRDITERKHNEEALRASEQRFSIAFNASPLPLTISRLEDGRFLAVNDRFVQKVGYSREEMLGRTALELDLWVNPEDRVRLMERLKRDESVRDTEAHMRVKSGKERVLLLSVETIELEGQQCLLHALNDITERKQAEEQLRGTRDQLRALTARLHDAREAEGVRIAREIHDELGSALTSLRWDLEAMDKALRESENGSALSGSRRRLANMTKLVDSTINAVRRISAELRPGLLDDLGLAAAIEWQAQQFQERTGIVCEYQGGLEDLDLDQDQSIAVFRILQEALTNVLRHAQATRVEIKIERLGEALVLVVSDDGRGITDSELLSHQSLGLLGMRERAQLMGGSVRVCGVGGEGTTVTVEVPLARSRIALSRATSRGN